MIETNLSACVLTYYEAYGDLSLGPKLDEKYAIYANFDTLNL